MEATNQLSETKLISLDITEAKSLLMRLLCVTLCAEQAGDLYFVCCCLLCYNVRLIQIRYRWRLAGFLKCRQQYLILFN